MENDDLTIEKQSNWVNNISITSMVAGICSTILSLVNLLLIIFSMLSIFPKLTAGLSISYLIYPVILGIYGLVSSCITRKRKENFCNKLGKITSISSLATDAFIVFIYFAAIIVLLSHT